MSMSEASPQSTPQEKPSDFEAVVARIDEVEKRLKGKRAQLTVLSGSGQHQSALIDVLKGRAAKLREWVREEPANAHPHELHAEVASEVRGIDAQRSETSSEVQTVEREIAALALELDALHELYASLRKETVN